MNATTDSAATPAAGTIVPFEFRATGGQYFRIWIVNLLLTILTLGIYSAWAKVRRLRYLYGSTSLAGSAFEYHGEPLQILKGRLIAVAAFAVYWVVTDIWPLAVLILLLPLMFLMPFVIVMSRRFQMRMTSWRNIRFGFHGRYGGALAAYIGWGLLALITLYALVPLWIYKRVQYLLDNTSFGQERFELKTGMGRYFAIYYITVGLGLAAFLLLITSVTATTFMARGGPISSTAAIGGSVLFAIVLIGVPLVLGAYWERSFTNANYDGLEVGPHRVRCRLRMGRLLSLYVTNILGVLLTLGLFYPWALIRRLRYQFECLSVEVSGSLDDIVAGAAPQASATGEAVGEVFDVDFGM